MTTADIIKDVASESGHWYRQDGTPAYEIVGANGKQRPTTLRDARKLGLVPSVTTILRVMAAPGLEQWKRNNLLLSALTAPPRTTDESEDDWIARIVRDADEQAAKARELGTDIHGAIERLIKRQPYGYKEHAEGAVDCVMRLFDIDLDDLSAEHSFAHPLGFGGKLDVHSTVGCGMVCDFKSKPFSLGDVGKKLAWDEHVIQLAAYRVGVGIPNARCVNVFVSTTTPWLSVVHEWTQDELQRGWQIFECLLRLWKLKNNVA